MKQAMKKSAGNVPSKKEQINLEKNTDPIEHLVVSLIADRGF